jgi:hypothetical protein
MTEKDQTKVAEQGVVAEQDRLQSEHTDTVRAYREAVVHEYSQYVAVKPIDFGNARAYNVGDPVPASNVAAYGYLERGAVAKVGTKAAEQAKG